MRGQAQMVTIHSPDMSELERIAHSDTTPWYQVRALANCSGNRRRPTARRPRDSARVRQIHHLANLSTVSGLGGSAACLPIRRARPLRT